MVLAVDSKGHSRPLAPVAAQREFKKFCVIGEKFVVGTVGMICCPQIEYEFENWIAAWASTEFAALSPKTLDRVASSLYKQMGKSIKALEGLPDNALWKSDPRVDLPVDLLVEYVVAGYDDGVPKLLKFAAHINRNDRRIEEIPIHWCDNPTILGNREFLSKIDCPGNERELYFRIKNEIRSRPAEMLPSCGQKLLFDAVARIKVEAHFNYERVGGTINAVVIERETGLASLFAF